LISAGVLDGAEHRRSGESEHRPSIEEDRAVGRDIVSLYRWMSQDDRLQRDWEQNQPRTDRALEAGLNVRITREVATAILQAFKLICEPAARSLSVPPEGTVAEAELRKYARERLGAGGARLANLLERTEPIPAEVRTAALTSLRFYRCRPDPANELVRLPWTPEGLRNLCAAPDDQLVAPCLRVPQAARKAAGVRELAQFLLSPGHPDEKELRERLQAMPSFGPERAEVVGVFAFRRGWPITDNYLWQVLQRHGLLTPEESKATIFTQRRRLFVPHWRRLLAADLGPPDALAANLYLWACEVGRYRISYDLDDFVPADSRG
jgi:hypothetical protein